MQQNELRARTVRELCAKSQREREEREKERSKEKEKEEREKGRSLRSLIYIFAYFLTLLTLKRARDEKRVLREAGALKERGICGSAGRRSGPALTME